MLAANTVLKELDVSSNAWQEHGWTKGDGPGFAKELAVGISDNGALTKLDASDNDMFGLTDETGITAWAAALKACASITVLNLAKNNINTNDTKILAPAIRDMGALIKLDISSNYIGAAQEWELQRICTAGGIELTR
jgi:hypothetical protein